MDDTASKHNNYNFTNLSDNEKTGLTHECGIFGCIGSGTWPTKVDIAQTICLGLIALQHR